MYILHISVKQSRLQCHRLLLVIEEMEGQEEKKGMSNAEESFKRLMKVCTMRCDSVSVARFSSLTLNTCAFQKWVHHVDS